MKQSEWKAGWNIVLSAFCLTFVTDGFVYAFGILLVELVDHFNEERAIVVTIVAILTATQYFTGQLASGLGVRFGYRKVVVTGALVRSAGFIVSSYATNIYILWITYGLLGGVSFGLMYLSAFASVLLHFDKHKTLASGITASGSGVGTFVLSYCCRMSIDHFGWRGTVLFQAGIVLQGVIFGLLLSEPVVMKPTEDSGVAPSTVSSRIKSFVKSIFKKDLLKDQKYLLFLAFNFLVYLGLVIPFTFIPDQVEHDGMTKSEAAILASSMGVSNTVSRVLFGLIGDRVCFDRIYLLAGSELLNGVLTGMSPLMTSFGTILIYAVMFGSFVGAYNTLAYVVLTDIVTSDLIASALGLLFLTLGIAAAVSTPLAGFLFDQTRSYAAAFIVSGVEFIIGSLLLFMCKLFPFKAGVYEVNT